MTVNTQALVPAAQKSGKPVDAAKGDGGGKSTKDTAAQFQSLLSGMKDEQQGAPDGDTQVKTAESQAQQDNPAQGRQTGVTPGSETTKSGSDGKGADIAFSTSNLTDALRQVSQNVLTSKELASLDGSDMDQTAGGTGSGAPSDAAAVAVGLPLKAVLASQTVGPVQAPGRPQAQQNPQSSMPSGAGQFNETAARGGEAKTGASSLFAQFGVEPERVSDALSGNASGRSMLPEEAAGSVKVLRQETHFAPNMRLSPAQQVGEQITSALKDVPRDTFDATERAVGQSRGPGAENSGYPADTS